MTRFSFAGLCQRTSVQAFLVLLVACAYLGHFQFLTPFIVETDGYFHTKVAWLLRTRGVLYEFPWTAFSLWSEHYFDKEWLYHEMLSLFTFGDLVKGAKVAAVAFGSTIFVSFYLVLRWSGIRSAIFWTILMLVGSGGYFGWRVCLTRPHVWSITLSLWAMYFVLRAAPWRLLATSAIYALSYTAPYVTIGYAAVNVAARRLLDRRWALSLPVASLFGVAAGWLVHPQRRSALIAVWTQTVQVLLSNQQYDTPNLHLGGELAPAPWQPFLREHAALFLAVAVAAWVWWRLRPRITSATATLAVMSLGFFAMTLMSKRFVEYWVPFTFWACASVIDPVLERLGEAVPGGKEKEWPRFLAWSALTMILTFIAQHTWRENLMNYSNPRASGEMPSAAWLRSHTPNNSLVFTCDWDEAPELLFYDEHNRYLVALDPNYMYRWNPEIWKIWDEIANGRSYHSPADMITKIFGAQYGFCTNNFSELKSRLLHDPRVKMHDLGGSGYVFEIVSQSLNRSTPTIPQDRLAAKASVGAGRLASSQL